MTTKGIRIADSEHGYISVNLPDILNEIDHGEQYSISLLDLYSTGSLGEGKSIPDLEDQICDSEKGLSISWEDLVLLSSKFSQVIDIVIIMDKNKNLLYRYDTNQKMFESCEIIIQMVDGCFWEIFSKDEHIIERLEKKFKRTELITSDYLP